MAQFSLQQVSLFYLLIIAALAYYGFQNSMRLGAALGIALGDAAGSALGAILGVLISFQLFKYVRQQGMISMV